VNAAGNLRFFLRDLEAFAAILACALAFVGGIVSFALGHFGWMAVAAVACAVLFVLANRLEERRDREEPPPDRDAQVVAAIAALHSLEDWRHHKEPARYDDPAALMAMWAPRPRRFWAAYGWYAWLGLGLALLTPEAVAHSPLVVGLVDGLARWIPSIDRFARISSLPDVTRFWIAAMWLLMPAATAYHALKPYSPPPKFTFGTMRLREYLIVFLLVPLMCLNALGITFWFYDVLDPYRPGALGDSAEVHVAEAASTRLGLGCFGSMLFWAQSALLGALLRTYVRILFFSFRRPE
jgi:hypothetical protein